MVRKNQKLKNRIFALFVVAFIICLSVVPAFALSEGSGSDGVYYPSSFPVDFISTPHGDQFPWPAAHGSFGVSTDFPFDFDRAFYGSVSNIPLGPNVQNYPGSFVTDFTIFDYRGGTDNSYLRFHSDTLLLTSASSFRVETFEDVATIYQIVVTCEVNAISSDAPPGRYTLTSSYFHDGLSTIGTSEAYNVDIADVIRRLMPSVDFAAGDVVFLSRLVVEVRFQHKPTQTPAFVVTEYALPTNTSVPGLLYNWIYDNSLVVSSGSGGSSFNFDWLMNSVQAVLDLQIAPGWSLNSVFVIVLVVGVMMWFLKLVS